jgi:3-dehydroquinate synthetase
MVLAFDFSARLGHATGQSAERVRRHLAHAGLPTGLGALGRKRADPDRLIAHMRHDKKVSDGRLTFILAREIGEAFVARDVADAALREFLVSAAST